MTDEQILAAMEEYAQQKIRDFVAWHNQNYPDHYIYNSRIGMFNLNVKMKKQTEKK